jgi:hypothetical protein
MPDWTSNIRAFSALALAAAALALAACGGDDGGGDGGSGASPTKAEFIEQGDAICQEMYTQRDPLEVQAAKAAERGDPDRAADVFENAAEITENRMDELGELPAPDGDGDTVDDIVNDGKDSAEAAKDAAEAIRREDESALAEISNEGREATVAFNKAAIDYGFLVCGRGAQVTIG